MADIAMLVTEEYERRVKNSRKSSHQGANDEEIEYFAHVSVSAKRVDLESSFCMMKEEIGGEKMETVKMVFEPKSDIGVAASKCFFSA
mgnify:CR=1 FL=1